MLGVTTRVEIGSRPWQLSLNFSRLLRVVITPSVTSLLRVENDSKQSDEFQASDSSKISAFEPQEHQIRMCSDERD